MGNIKDKDFLKKHRTEWQDFLWNRFLEKFAGKKSDNVRDVISALFSDYERRLVTRRIAALALIQESVGTMEISRILWFSRTTISTLKKIFFNKQIIYKSSKDFKKSVGNDYGKSTKNTRRSLWLEDLLKGVDLWEIIKNPPRPQGLVDNKT